MRWAGAPPGGPAYHARAPGLGGPAAGLTPGPGRVYDCRHPSLPPLPLLLTLHGLYQSAAISVLGPVLAVHAMPGSAAPSEAGTSSSGRKRPGRQERVRLAKQERTRLAALAAGRQDPAVSARAAQTLAANERAAAAARSASPSSGSDSSAGSRTAVSSAGPRRDVSPGTSSRSSNACNRSEHRRTWLDNRVRNHLARTGRTYTDMRPEELQAVAEGGEGSMASSVRQEAVAQAAEAARAADPMPRLQHALARLHIPAQVPPGDYTRRFIAHRVVDGDVVDVCTLCGRTATDGHLTSAGHLRRLEDQALGDLLAGQADSTRNLTMGRVNRGMYSLPTQAAALSFWGHGLTDLVATGLARINLSPGVMVDLSLRGPGRRLVAPGFIRTAELGLLKYGGCGKYFRNDFWYWQDLPSDADILTRPADEQLAAPAVDVAQREPRLARGRPRPHSTVQTPADDEGWWPVLILVLDPALAERITPVSPGWRVILVICFYQLMGSEHSAWWLEIPIWD